MENDKGFIKLSRRFFSNAMWIEARTFSGCEAWLDLIQSARFDATPRKVSIGGREVVVCRGQYAASIRYLSKRWQWSEKKVRSFLGHLKKEGMITAECTQGINLITLVKYDQYNDAGTTGGTTGGTDTAMIINQLKDEWAQLRAQLGAHPHPIPAQTPPNPEKPGHTGGTNTKKEEERSITTTTELNPKKETSPDGEAKKDGLSLTETAGKDKIDYEALMDYYNTTFRGKLPGIRAMTDTRRKNVRARIAQYGKNSVMQAFQSVLDSPFLLGDNDRGWTADFDWIFKPANFTKILEQRYNGKRTDTIQSRRASRGRLASLAAEILAADAAKDRR